MPAPKCFEFYLQIMRELKFVSESERQEIKLLDFFFIILALEIQKVQLVSKWTHFGEKKNSCKETKV